MLQVENIIRRKKMNWLHLSDIHFNPIDDGTDSLYLRKRLIDFLKENNIKVDNLILTGDFRDARHQSGTDEDAKIIVEYILFIAKTIGIKDRENILLVPGNHDLDRAYSNRIKIVTKNKSNYRTECGKLEDIDVLVDSFKFYKKIITFLFDKNYADNLYENMYKINPHIVTPLKDVSILHLNTELLAGEIIKYNGKDKINDESGITVGSKYVINALSQTEFLKKPVIVIAHRGLDLLELYERKKLINIFKDYNVCIYLCGHNHDLWCDETYPIPQITVGCIRQENGVRAGFSIGELNESTNTISIGAYSWENDCWNNYSHFCSIGSKLKLDISDKVVINDDDYSNTIYIVIDGEIREFKCNAENFEFGEEGNNIITCKTGSVICTILNNDYSKKIRIGDRFILSHDVWKVMGINDTIKNKTVLHCKWDFQNPCEDDMEKRIANKHLIKSS